LERMRVAGKSSKEIARRLGRTENAVDIAWCRYGPSPEYRKVQAYLALVREVISKSLRIVNEDPGVLRVRARSRRKVRQ
jgi:hypothetical protein